MITRISRRRTRQLRRMSPFARIKLRVSRRYGVSGNPENGMERRHRIETAVEPKHVFVEIGLQVFWFNTTVVRPLDPSFQVTENEVDHRQMRLCFVWVAA